MPEAYSRRRCNRLPLARGQYNTSNGVAHICAAAAVFVGMVEADLPDCNPQSTC